MSISKYILAIFLIAFCCSFSLKSKFSDLVLSTGDSIPEYGDDQLPFKSSDFLTRIMKYAVSPDCGIHSKGKYRLLVDTSGCVFQVLTLRSICPNTDTSIHNALMNECICKKWIVNGKGQKYYCDFPIQICLGE